ncbi:LPXTG cell wall anchor domain-containing protein, partial [Limosilactobacillus reuteri subsp. suis]
ASSAAQVASSAASAAQSAANEASAATSTAESAASVAHQDRETADSAASAAQKAQLDAQNAASAESAALSSTASEAAGKASSANAVASSAASDARNEANIASSAASEVHSDASQDDPQPTTAQTAIANAADPQIGTTDIATIRTQAAEKTISAHGDGASDPATPANNHGKANNNQQLPQTGNEHHDKTALLGLLTAGLLGMAIDDRKKKRN